MPRFPEPIRAVVFDAVGTLIQLDPLAGDVYAQFAARFGSRLDAEQIRRRFALAFAAQERNDAERGHRTDEDRELGRWQQIVGEVIDDIDSMPCFQALYDHFAEASSWRCDPDTAGLIRELKGRGFVVGMASNFDFRLRAIVAGSPELAGLDHLWISSEVGWKKPAEGFFREVRRTLGTESGHILFVGDDRTNDYDGATAAGMPSLLFDPRGRSDLPGPSRIARLADLLTLNELTPRG